MPQTIKIGTDLFLELYRFMTTIDISQMDDEKMYEYAMLLNALARKKGALAARQAYAEVIQAGKDTQARATAYKNYKDTRLIYEALCKQAVL